MHFAFAPAYFEKYRVATSNQVLFQFGTQIQRQPERSHRAAAQRDFLKHPSKQEIKNKMIMTCVLRPAETGD